MELPDWVIIDVFPILIILLIMLRRIQYHRKEYLKDKKEISNERQ